MKKGSIGIFARGETGERENEIKMSDDDDDVDDCDECSFFG